MEAKSTIVYKINFSLSFIFSPMIHDLSLIVIYLTDHAEKPANIVKCTFFTPFQIFCSAQH